MSVKNPETLLKLSKNPFYKMSESEQKILDDFLSQESVSDTQSSPKKRSRKRAKTTPATVKETPKDSTLLAKNRVHKVTGEIEEEVIDEQ